MRVFVTGASGFIGAHVTRELLSRGHSVTVLAVPGDTLWRLRSEAGRFAVVTGRLEDTSIVRSALTDFRPEACVHLAWFAEHGTYLHSQENLSSLAATLTFLRELIEANCQHVVMAGTCAEYDTRFGFLREDTPTRPTTLYGAAKLACWLLCEQIASQAKANLAWGRIFYPYGPQDDARRVIPGAIRALQQDQVFQATTGEQVRDYIHAEDVASAFCLLAEKHASGLFNIASGMPVTIRDLLTMIGGLMGRENLIEFGARPYREWEPPFICGDNRRLRQMGWKPRWR
ncbi:MAG: hypothetical protein A2Z25_19430, partial [Planctomycetes bacterium RBG_16_55_9]